MVVCAEGRLGHCKHIAGELKIALADAHRRHQILAALLRALGHDVGICHRGKRQHNAACIKSRSLLHSAFATGRNLFRAALARNRSLFVCIRAFLLRASRQPAYRYETRCANRSGGSRFQEIPAGNGIAHNRPPRSY